MLAFIICLASSASYGQDFCNRFFPESPFEATRRVVFQMLERVQGFAENQTQDFVEEQLKAVVSLHVQIARMAHASGSTAFTTLLSDSLEHLRDVIAHVLQRYDQLVLPANDQVLATRQLLRHAYQEVDHLVTHELTVVP